jgi:hypothetical protein
MAEKNFKLDYPELMEKVVLNVDDNEMNQLVIAKIMGKRWYENSTCYKWRRSCAKIK